MNTLDTWRNGVDWTKNKERTGYNFEILKSIWKTREAIQITTTLYWDYIRFCDTSGAQDIFTATFFCKSGRHRSVAVCYLFKCVILEFFKKEGNTDDLVRQINLSEWTGKTWKLCPKTCMHCQKGKEKDDWIVQQVLRVTIEVLKQ